MKLDPGMHIGLHLVFFGKTGVTALEHVEGEGLLYEGGEGSARLIANDCLKYLFI
jgi:hypothetical protein